VYDLMRHDRLVLSKDSAERLSRSLAKGVGVAPVTTDKAPAAAPVQIENKPVKAKSAETKAKGARGGKSESAGEAPAKPRAPRKPAAKPKAKE
jgi:hypothetical protein